MGNGAKEKGASGRWDCTVYVWWQSAESPKRVTLECRDKGLSFVGAVEVFQAHRTDTAWLPKVLGPGRGWCGWSRGREGGGGR